MAETSWHAGDLANHINLVRDRRECIRFYRCAAYCRTKYHLLGRRHHLDSANASAVDLDGNGIIPRTTSSLETWEVARVTGLEPATSGVTGRRSNQLSYTR